MLPIESPETETEDQQREECRSNRSTEYNPNNLKNTSMSFMFLFLFLFLKKIDPPITLMLGS